MSPLPHRQWRPPRAFSLIETVFSLVILSLLSFITITYYGEDTSRSREDAARARAETLARAVQRWELERRRDYPYENLAPLAGRYVDSAGQDPWGNEFSVDLERGFVYSHGPNTVDDGGDGDDIRYPFRAPRVTDRATKIAGGVVTTTAPADLQQVPPSPPRNLRFDLQSKELRWEPPLTFSDGTPLTAATHLKGYRVSYLDNDGRETLEHQFSSPSDTRYQLPGELAQNRIYTVRAYYLDQASALVESAPSNQAGVFKPEKVGPIITRFEPSNTRPPVRSKELSFRIEVFDGDANLEKVELSGGLGTHPVFDHAASPDKSRFKVSLSAYKGKDGAFNLEDSGAIGELVLTASDPDSANTTTWRLPAGTIEVVNTAPVVAFRPDRSSVIRGTASPSFTTGVEITVEAQDAESNLILLTLQQKTPVAGTLHQIPLPEPGGPKLSLSKSFNINTTGSDVTFEVVAKDSNDLEFKDDSYVITIAADETPPETAVVSLNASNVFLTTHPIRCETNDERARGVSNWFVRDPENLTITWSSFEAETPPVHYKVAVSPLPPTSWTTTFVPLAVTSGDGGWHVPTPSDTVASYVLSVASNGLTRPLSEGVPYYLGVLAANDAKPPIANLTISEPRNPLTGCLQNSFVVDASPPTVGEIQIDQPLNCATFEPVVINGISGLTARWPTAADNPGGSGLSSYSYRLVSQPPAGAKQTLYDVPDHRASEINNLAIGSQDGNLLTLSVKARDSAGNESAASSTIDIQVDSTPPFFQRQPLIENLTKGVITDPNRFEGSWNSVFVDNEQPSLPLSFEWGISTTFPIRGIPDRSPGGWQIAGQNTAGAIDQPGLLAIGDTVYLVVRATNCANSTSIETYSAPAVVSADFFAQLKATPSSGFQDLTVKFDLEVVGGDPPYNFSFDYGGPGSGGESTVPTTDSCPGSSDTSCTRSATYRQIGSHTALGTIETNTGARTRAFARVQVLPQPYLLALGATSLSVLDIGSAAPELAKAGLAPPGVTANRLELVEVGETKKFVLLSARGTVGATGGVYRFDLDSDSTQASAIETAPARDEAEDLDVARDFRTVLVTNDAGGNGSLRRLRLDPTLDFARAEDTPLSMTPSLPTSGTGNPAACVILPSGSEALAVNRLGPVLSLVTGLGAAQPGVDSEFPLPLTDPGFMDLASDGSTFAVVDRGAARLFRGTVSAAAGAATTISGTSVIGLAFIPDDVELDTIGRAAYAIERGGSRLTKVDYSTGATLATSAYGAAELRGLDVARDGSLIAVGDSTGKVRIIRSSDMEVAETVDISGPVRDVAFFERPNFGRPVISRLRVAGGGNPTSGSTVDALGFNLGPVSGLSVSLVSESATVPPSSASVVTTGSNGFNLVRFTVPTGYPAGSTQVLVRTSVGSSTPGDLSRLTVR